MSATPSEGSHVRMLLGAYVLGALCPDEDRDVARHLKNCDECGAEYLEMTEASALLAMVCDTDLLETLGGLGDDSSPRESGGL